MKRIMSSSFYLSICLLFAALATRPLFAQENPPARAARLSYARGSVSLQPSGEDQWSQASVNYTVTTGDRIYTDQGSRAELQVGPYAVRLSETTDLTMANLNDQMMQLGLAQGTIRVTLLELPSQNTVEIDTPNGALTLLRAGSYRVDSDPNNGSTIVTVDAGSLQVSGGGADQTVQAGQAVQLTGSQPVQVSSVEPAAPDDFDQWSASRDRRLQSATSARHVSRYMPGYDDLDTYGRWRSVPEYGDVWVPTDVPAGWVPYRYGHWVWVEPWGWTWVEDEPWGFAPFHYGRWAFVGSAWCWVPGPVAVAPVYAPALVAFVGGGGFSVGLQLGGVGVQAWFPLGPREPFVPWYHYGGDYLNRVNVTNVRNVTNITNITNVTNINNITYVNRTVGTTAVREDAFRTGQPVARAVVHVAPEQIARAQVVAHPSVAPARQAALAGRPVAAPKIRPAKVIAAPTAAAARPGAPAARPQPGVPAGRPQPPTATRNPGGQPPTARPPLVTRTTPPQTAAPNQTRQAPPAPVTHAPSAERGMPAANRPAARPPLITRTPPPPHNVPFQARQPALAEHPGRPLEPQQRENLRAGRPAGPMRDREIAPHEAPRAARPSPSPRSESKPAPQREEPRKRQEPPRP